MERTDSDTSTSSDDESQFQFPSNGKGHGKCPKSSPEAVRQTCFNSLQTGKGMESRADLDSIGAMVVLVSIPFKRERAWKARHFFVAKGDP